MTTHTTISNGDIDPESPITTSLITALRDNPTAIAEQDPTAPVIRFRIDPFLANFGNNIDGDLTVTGSGSISLPVYEADNYVLNSGVILTSTIGLLIIRARTSIEINGTIRCRGDEVTVERDTSFYFPGNAKAGGSGGGEGGFSATLDGQDTFIGNLAGGSPGNSGTNGASMTADLMNRVAAMAGSFLGGGGDGGKSSTSGLRGGNAGGVVVLAAPSVTIGASGSIDVRGEDGIILGGGSYSGGGGGGLIYLVGETVTNNGSTNVSGGTGGGSGTGGDGGSGYALTVTL